MPPYLPSSNAHLFAQLDRLIAECQVDIHFQPLVDIDRAALLGYEALTRGPADSPLHSPLVLFEAAAQAGRLIELERMVLRRALRRFRELGLPGQIFLNVTVDTVLAAEARVPGFVGELAEIGLSPSRIVFEITETRPILEYARLGRVLDALRSHGFVVALDDLGEGFAGLKRWMEIRPDFVKIDRHFIDGVAQEPLKQQFVRSILEMAATSGCKVVAEGLEQPADLAVLRRLGVPFCQGYLIARPSATPRPQLRAETLTLLGAERQQRRSALPFMPPEAITTAEQLARRGPTVTAAVKCQRVVEMFTSDELLFSMPVLDEEQRPVGILRSLQVLKRSSERFFREIQAKRSCVELMDANPLVFDVATSLREMSEAISNLDDRLMVDGFIVTRDGRYHGSGRTSDLLKAVSDLQVCCARYANPLTQLPGNVPIDSHLDALVAEERDFVVATWDIDNFKPFNDLYGYHRGDQIIKLTAQILSQAADAELDFVGHIGGDDFIMVLGSSDWQQRLQAVCEAFDAGVRSFFSPEHVQGGGYVTLNRQNQPHFTPLPTISAGVIGVRAGQFNGAHQISAALAEPKRVAKSMSGASRIFVDRRHPPLPQAQTAAPALPETRALATL
jgi:EAL domain-containing protein (putative c-di-GMP-specific phosphodiesterase class I)/GGDEF domain-containing protein